MAIKEFLNINYLDYEMSTAQETKSLYLQLCLEKKIDMNQEFLFLICQEEENDQLWVQYKNYNLNLISVPWNEKVQLNS